MTILISSHILEELSKIATDYGIIHNGTLLQELTKEELMRRCSERIEITLDIPERAIPVLDRLGFIQYQVTDKTHIQVYERSNESAALNMELTKAGISVRGITLTSEELESYPVKSSSAVYLYHPDNAFLSFRTDCVKNESYHLELKRCCVNQVLKQTIFSYYDEWTTKGIEPDIHITDKLLYIDGNETALQSVFQNVIKNALDHGANYKADTARSKNSSGLGLSIAKEFTERMHGKISVELTGNIFCIRICFE